MTMDKARTQIPQLAVYRCNGCGEETVAAVGSQMLCQNCVNQFLARNIGIMQPVPPELVETGGVTPKVERDGTG
jgi:hypothetical protein